MTNTFKAIAIVAKMLAFAVAVAGVFTCAIYLAMHGHARLIGVVGITSFLCFAVWVVKVDLDYRDRTRARRQEASTS